MMLERYSDALECVDGALEERPDFASAYDQAAHCAFQSGDKIKGLRYAKEARMRGMYTEHRVWEGFPRTRGDRPSKEPAQLILISISVVTAVRVTAYIDEDLSRDIARILPFALLGLFIASFGGS